MKTLIFRLLFVFTFVAITAPAFAQEKTTESKTQVLPALPKVQSLPVQVQQISDEAATYTLDADKLQHTAPELVQIRIETLPSPHARMPHLTQQKRVPAVDYTAVVPLLVKAMQEQQAEIERLRTELAAMKARAQK